MDVKVHYYKLYAGNRNRIGRSNPQVYLIPLKELKRNGVSGAAAALNPARLQGLHDKFAGTLALSQLIFMPPRLTSAV